MYFEFVYGYVLKRNILETESDECFFFIVVGWASGHFGWFGLKNEEVEHPSLNYIGVALACVSGLIFLALKTQVPSESDNETQPILAESADPINRNVSDNSSSKKSVRLRLTAAVLAVVSGIFFGLVFTPSTYIQDHPEHYPGASKNGLYYIFPMYTGIFLSSMVYYAVYIIWKKNRPYLHIQSILPAFISGIMWGIAQAGFLLANSVLSQAISFPLISIGPATIATLWSILYIKDIRGMKNYLVFLFGTTVRIVAAVLIILSKPKSN